MSLTLSLSLAHILTHLSAHITSALTLTEETSVGWISISLGSISTAGNQAWLFNFRSSFVAHVANVLVLLVLDLRPSVSKSLI